MTENKAIDILNNLVIEGGDKSRAKVAIDIAIQALEEIQSYRAIGTVEKLKSRLAQIAVYQKELQKYMAIGTVEEFKALKEKSEPQKILKRENGFKCPTCNHWIGYRYGYCDGCGQVLDWSE